MSFSIIPVRAVEDDAVASAASSAASIFASTFDGTNDFVTIPVGVNTAAATISFWYKIPAAPAATQQIATWRFATVRMNTDRTLDGVFYNTTGVVLRITSSVAASAGVWNHALYSIRLTGTHSANSGDFQFYHNDAIAGDTVTVADSAVTSFRWDNQVFLGVDRTGGSRYDGDLAIYSFTPQWLDLTVTANRRKFITSAGAPVAQGVSGDAQSLSPWWYHNDGVSAWHANKGTLGGGSLTGALVSASVPTSAGQA